jgi:hypothetical protein
VSCTYWVFGNCLTFDPIPFEIFKYEIDATVTTQELHPCMHYYGRCYVCSLARRSLPHFGVLLHKTTVAVALMHLNWRAIHASARYSQIIPSETIASHDIR